MRKFSMSRRSRRNASSLPTTAVSKRPTRRRRSLNCSGSIPRRPRPPCRPRGRAGNQKQRGGLNGGTMPFDLVVRGGTVVLPQTDGVAADIAISEEKIAAILAPGTAVEAAATLDVTDQVVLPGV